MMPMSQLTIRSLSRSLYGPVLWPCTDVESFVCTPLFLHRSSNSAALTYIWSHRTLCQYPSCRVRSRTSRSQRVGEAHTSSASTSATAPPL